VIIEVFGVTDDLAVLQHNWTAIGEIKDIVNVIWLIRKMPRPSFFNWLDQSQRPVLSSCGRVAAVGSSMIMYCRAY